MATLYRNGTYVAAFVLGFCLMAFEMLGSRYLNPYFGSGIATWAALIATVLAALMIGYFLGGNLVDRWPRMALCGYLVIAAAIYLFMLPLLIDPLIGAIIALLGDAAIGVIGAAIALLLVPLTLIGTFSPFGVRLLLEERTKAGRVTGWVYGISTAGNIIGTLATTFALIPTMGTRAITSMLAVTVGICGLALIMLDQARPRR
jgi:MFS family permease